LRRRKKIVCIFLVFVFLFLETVSLFFKFVFKNDFFVLFYFFAFESVYKRGGMLKKKWAVCSFFHI